MFSFSFYFVSDFLLRSDCIGHTTHFPLPFDSVYLPVKSSGSLFGKTYPYLQKILVLFFSFHLHYFPLEGSSLITQVARQSTCPSASQSTRQSVSYPISPTVPHTPIPLFLPPPTHSHPTPSSTSHTLPSHSFLPPCTHLRQKELLFYSRE